MHLMHGAPGRRNTIDNGEYLYFCGTGYLGLQNHPRLIQASCEAARQYGMGTATSRTGYGTAPPVAEVEKKSAQFWEAEDAFYFASGYLGNQVVLSVLAKSAGVVLLDEHSHYSIIDACKSSGLPVVRFAHNDTQALQEALRANAEPGNAPLVMCDGVFATSGEIVPIREYIEVLQEYDGAMLCLDECHAYGVLGETGRGVYQQYGIALSRVNQSLSDLDPPSGTRLYSLGTLSKAFGGYGGIVAGSRSFIEEARNSSRYFSGASAPPTPVAAASAAALEIVAATPELVTHLQHNARSLRQRLRSLGLEVDDIPTPVVGLSIGDENNMRRIQQGMADDGVLIAYAREYSGLGPCGGLRIAVFATHTEADLRDLSGCLARRL